MTHPDPDPLPAALHRDRSSEQEAITRGVASTPPKDLPASNGQTPWEIAGFDAEDTPLPAHEPDAVDVHEPLPAETEAIFRSAGDDNDIDEGEAGIFNEETRPTTPSTRAASAARIPSARVRSTSGEIHAASACETDAGLLSQETDAAEAGAPPAVDEPTLDLLGYASSDDPELEPVGTDSSSAIWTLPLLCAGIGLIACCLLIPLADVNRRAAYERQVLRNDLESVQRQVAVNDEFLRRIGEDPTLAERLAQRQMKSVRAGARILSFAPPGSSGGAGEMSPFQLVAVPPPPPLAPYQPKQGTLATLCFNPRTRLYLIGAALTMMAAGLVLGATGRRA